MKYKQNDQKTLYWKTEFKMKRSDDNRISQIKIPDAAVAIAAAAAQNSTNSGKISRIPRNGNVLVLYGIVIMCSLGPNLPLY